MGMIKRKNVEWDFREEKRRDARGRSTLYSDRMDVTLVSQDLPIMPNYRALSAAQ
jgi:hypothetical protein